LLPSAEVATLQTFATGVPAGVQVWAKARFTAVNQPQKAAAISIAILVFMRVWRFQENTGITHAISNSPSKCVLSAGKRSLDAWLSRKDA
jgi:hypothetical protein